MKNENAHIINEFKSSPSGVGGLSVTGLFTPLGDGGLKDISFALNEAEHLLITGASGSGKTTLAKVLANKIFYKGSVEFNINQPKIILVEQHYYFKTLSNTNEFYYQQRYNSFDSNDAATVKKELLKINNDETAIDTLLSQLQLTHRKNDSLLHLSSGEHKRFQLIKAFLQHADIFIFDSPFTGLDVNSRKVLRKLIDEKSAASAIIIIADIEDAPLCITNVLELENGEVKNFIPVELFNKYSIANNPRLPVVQEYSIFNGNIPFQNDNSEFNVAVKLENVSVAYGNKKIISNISWQINRGERWLIKGVNGAGKSTLISLITGDHPQAYSNKVFLFDKKRGSGESIWDIKKKIGYVSPELHWYFDKTISVYNTIAS
ncbi:MAG: ATP-binding cassette domain-containing protein, partial [Parafilimonas sp.]